MCFLESMGFYDGVNRDFVIFIPKLRFKSQQCYGAEELTIMTLKKQQMTIIIIVHDIVRLGQKLSPQQGCCVVV